MNTQLVFDYLSFWGKAKTKHGIHSPLAYEFVEKVLPRAEFPFKRELSELRIHYLKSKETLLLTDFGAGYAGRSIEKVPKTLADICKSSGRRATEGELLYRICQYYQPKKCLELGTNLGFSSIYQNLGLSGAQFITLEGDPQLAQEAKRNLTKFKLEAQVIQGEFSDSLNTNIKWDDFQPDYVFLDGNHQYDAVIEYFEFLLPKLATPAIFIMDDLYWSEGMKKAWKHMSSHPAVATSLDLFVYGICFIGHNKPKEKFKIRFYPF